MLNVDLIRKVQESINDPANPFDMTHWETCICAHLKHVVTGDPIRSWFDPQVGRTWALPDAVRQLGLPMKWAIDHLVYGAMAINTRQYAIALLEELIEIEKAQPAAAPVSWEPKWQAVPVPWTVAIDQEERELVCV